MLFNTYIFIFFFLPITLIVYFLLNKQKLVIAAKAWLVLASLFFYGWWNPKYIVLIIGSISLNFVLGKVLGKTDRGYRKLALLFGIFFNIVLLVYYKYTNFFIENINVLSGLHLIIQKIILPLGISFFTFTQIAYLVDTYKRKTNEYSFLNYSLFVTFFPHLLAGPIIHHAEMMPQFDNKRNKLLHYRNMAIGLFLFFIGLFKKVVIADSFAPVANAGFDAAESLTFIEAWVTSLSYTLQLYFDFSAYTDMALGVALMFNIHLPRNFNSPYKATDIGDFWKRWHMTLSRFLKEYVYIPLGGNRRGEMKTHMNVLITFLIGGVWHGAGWTFLIWGLLHGVASVIHRLWKKLNIRMHIAIAWFLTFNFINASWVFFRAKTFGEAVNVLKGMLGLNGLTFSPHGPHWKILIMLKAAYGRLFYMSVDRNVQYWIFLALILVLAGRNSDYLASKFKPNRITAAFALTLAIFAFWNMNRVTEFLYFNF